MTEYLQSDGTYAKIENDYMVNDTTIVNRFIAFKNPFRYRSYYYDFETNLYYLNTRYYDPEIGRFIKTDDIAILNTTKVVQNGLNLYTYCINNPVNLIDENGDLPKWLKWILGIFTVVVVSIFTAGIASAAAFAFGVTTATAISIFTSSAVGGLISGGINLASQVIRNGGIDGINFGTLALQAFIGSASGALGGSNLSAGWQIVGNIVLSETNYFIGAAINKNSISFEGFVSALLVGAFNGLITGNGAMHPGSNLAWSSVWKNILPGTTIFAENFYKVLLQTTLNSSIKGALWSIFSEYFFGGIK